MNKKAKALAAFEQAVADYALIGAAHPSDHAELEARYAEAKAEIRKLLDIKEKENGNS